MYQFGQFAWTHMILLTVVLQGACFIRNIMDGLIWFVLPSSLVIFNDIMARHLRTSACAGAVEHA